MKLFDRISRLVERKVGKTQSFDLGPINKHFEVNPDIKRRPLISRLTLWLLPIIVHNGPRLAGCNFVPRIS